MGISVEDIGNGVYLLRGGTGHNKFGDEYTSVCAIILKDSVAKVKEIMCQEAFTKDDYVAIYDWLKSIGASEWWWERKKGNRYILIKGKEL